MSLTDISDNIDKTVDECTESLNVLKYAIGRAIDHDMMHVLKFYSNLKWQDLESGEWHYVTFTKQ